MIVPKKIPPDIEVLSPDGTSYLLNEPEFHRLRADIAKANEQGWSVLTTYGSEEILPNGAIRNWDWFDNEYRVDNSSARILNVWAKRAKEKKGG